MLEMLKWLCQKLMEAEVAEKIGAAKGKHTENRKGYRSGSRVRRFDSRMGTMYLIVPKVRKGGYIPFFVTEKKRSEQALMQVVQEAFINGVSTRKIERLAKSLGINSMSSSQVSEINKELNEQVKAFRERQLEKIYPILWVDALYEKIRSNGKVQSMAVHVVCGLNLEGKREILAIEPMYRETEASYECLFDGLKKRGLEETWLVISDSHKGLTKAIQKSFTGSSWQRCKVHFMRNILAHISPRKKDGFAAQLKQIWQQPDYEKAKFYANSIIDEFQNAYPQAISTLEDGLEDTLQYYNFPEIDPRKISSTNILERLFREIRRRIKVVGIFPSMESYIRLVSCNLMEYSEDWSDGRSYIKKEIIETVLARRKAA